MNRTAMWRVQMAKIHNMLCCHHRPIDTWDGRERVWSICRVVLCLLLYKYPRAYLVYILRDEHERAEYPKTKGGSREICVEVRALVYYYLSAFFNRDLSGADCR